MSPLSSVWQHEHIPVHRATGLNTNRATAGLTAGLRSHIRAHLSSASAGPHKASLSVWTRPAGRWWAHWNPWLQLEGRAAASYWWRMKEEEETAFLPLLQGPKAGRFTRCSCSVAVSLLVARGRQQGQETLRGNVTWNKMIVELYLSIMRKFSRYNNKIILF